MRVAEQAPAGLSARGGRLQQRKGRPRAAFDVRQGRKERLKRLIGGEGQQRDVAGALDGFDEAALVSGRR
jgi:hypothetical protein